MGNKNFVSVNLTEEARDALRAAVLSLTTEAGKRLTLSDVLEASIRVSLKRREEMLSALGTLSGQ